MSAIEFSEADLERGLSAVSSSLPTTRVTAQQIAFRVAQSHGLSVEDMLSRCRLRHIVQARTDLYRALRAIGWSYPAIGRLAGRDHTTIMAALNGKWATACRET